MKLFRQLRKSCLNGQDVYRRQGLKQMMQAVQGGFVRAVLVRDLTRLSHDPAILIQILEFLQDHDAVLDVYKRQI